MKLKEDAEVFSKMKQVKYVNKPSGGGVEKTLVNINDASFSFMVGIPTKEWYNIPFPWLMFCQTLSQEVLQMDTNTYKSKEVFLYNKRNDNIICVGDNILYVANNNPTYGGKLS